MMLFSRENRSDFWFVLFGCLVVALVIGLLIAFFGSFSLGWFTLASLMLLGQAVVGLFALCFVLAVLGLSEFFLWIGLVPLVVLSCFVEGDEAWG